jgi:hypothetical protein
LPAQHGWPRPPQAAHERVVPSQTPSLKSAPAHAVPAG